MTGSATARRSLSLLIPGVIALMMAIGTSARAQGDRRISTDPIQMVLPDDARIQAAATIGRRTLAVWGSSRVGSDGRARNVLYMQMFDGATRFGDQQILTTPDAEPAGHLQVLAVGGSFVVVWNDRRSGSTQSYMTRVALAGTIGEEEKLGRGALARPGMLAVTLDDGFLLLWSDSTEAMEIRERRVDRLGNPLSPERALDSGRVLGVKRPTGLWGTLLLERGDQPPLLLDADGRGRQIVGAAAEKFATPYYLDDDGSVLSIEKGVLHSYLSLLDTVPTRSVLLPLPGNVSTLSAIPSRDSLGRIQCYYATPDRTYYGNSAVMVWRITEFSLSKFSPPEYVAGALTSDFLGNHYTHSSELTGFSARRGCDNQYATTYSLKTDWSFSYHGYSSSGSGIAVRPMIVRRHGVTPLDSTLSDCNMTSTAWTGRAISKYASEIDLLAGGKLHRLSAPAAMLQVPVPHRSPVVMVEGANVLVAYHRLGLDSTMMLGLLNDGDSFSTIDSVNVDRVSNAPPGEAGVAKREKLLQGTNAFLLDTRARWRHRIDSAKTIDSQRCTIYLPGVAGWKKVLVKGASAEDGEQEYRAHTVARDPVSGDFVLAASIITGNGWYRQLLVAGFSTGGVRRWIADTIRLGAQPPPFSLIPVSPANYEVTTTFNLLRFERDSMLRSTEIGHVEGAQRLPLSSGHLLRWTRVWPSKQVALELLDSNGERLYASSAMLPDSAYDPTIIANPNNSGFIILTGSPHGVHAISLGATLATIGPAQRVCESTAPIFRPAGAIAGDRLYILWEDSRDGIMNIYGRSLFISTLW